MLTGLGDIKPTVRARVNASWLLAPGWQMGASWNVDAFGRGGGNFGDVSLTHERQTALGALSLGGSISLAGDRYLQTYYGVSAEQAARSAYAVYEPRSGLRDLSLFANWRKELDEHWVMHSGVGATRLLGPAAASPLAHSATSWGLNLALARRF